MIQGHIEKIARENRAIFCGIFSASDEFSWRATWRVRYRFFRLASAAAVHSKCSTVSTAALWNYAYALTLSLRIFSDCATVRTF